MALKLIKVAKDFSIGLHTIVETLRENGFSGVEEKPTAEITDAMLDVLKRKFQGDLAIKQEADKLLRPTLKKDPVAAPVVGGAAVPSSLPPLSRPGNLPPLRQEAAPAEPVAPPAPPPPPPPPAEEPNVLPRRELPSLRVVGKMDLNPPKPVAPPREEAPKKETPPPAAAPVQAEQPAPAPAPAPPPPPREERRPAPPPREERRPTPPPAAPPAPASTTPPVAPEGVAGESDLYRADSPTLRGLKVLGKINLETRSNTGGGGGNNRDRGGRGGQRSGGGNSGPGGDRRRDGQTAGPNRPNPEGGAAQGQGTSEGERQRRKRTNAQRPVTIEGLQTSMSNNQGDRRGPGNRTSGGPGGNNTGGNRPQTSGSGPNNRRGPGTGTGTGRPGEVRTEVSQKDIENQIRQTMARMGAGASRKRQKMRRGKRDSMRERAERAELAADQSGTLQVTEFISAADLASLMNVGAPDIIKTCMNLGIFVSINQRLDAEVIELVANEFGFEVQFISAEEQVEVEEEEIDNPADLQPRQPIVTVMGHVDHGKTSLLDFIRNANVAGGEAGGITQHIGAYEVHVGEGDQRKKVTFLDTPGHEAFTAMRARGAKVTDIAIIVIAADDSIMPQTREAISHAQAAGVPMVFAINKIDKAGADPERIKNELAQMNLLVEEWGGKYQSQDISAKKGLNMDKLLEKVVLEAEILELKANPNRRAAGTVLEASMEKGRGYVTKMLIENGTLHKGDPMIAGEFAGRVRAMFNDRGKEITEAGPSVPVLVLGLGGAPQAGEKIKVAASESEAKEIATKRSQILREQANRATRRISLEEIGRRLALGNFKELKLIVKGDVDGSVEALSDSLIKLSMEKIQVSVIHKAVGQIVDSDIMLASASDAIIVGFQVRPSLTARRLAEKEGVEIKMYSIIYEAIEEIRAAMEGMLEPTKEEEIVGQVEIREVFKITKVGTVAGCYVQEGKISRNNYVRIIRDGIVTYPVNQGQNAELSSLKRFKEDAKEVRAGLECGLTVRNFNDIKVGDVVEAYVINEVKATLH